MSEKRDPLKEIEDSIRNRTMTKRQYENVRSGVRWLRRLTSNPPGTTMGYPQAIGE